MVPTRPKDHDNRLIVDCVSHDIVPPDKMHSWRTLYWPSEQLLLTNLGRPYCVCSVIAHFASHGKSLRGELGLARGDLSASPSHHPYSSFKLIEVIFEPEFHIRHSSIPQLPESETYKDFSRIASFLLALESCIRRAIASSFFSWVLNSMPSDFYSKRGALK